MAMRIVATWDRIRVRVRVQARLFKEALTSVPRIQCCLQAPWGRTWILSTSTLMKTSGTLWKRLVTLTHNNTQLLQQQKTQTQLFSAHMWEQCCVWVCRSSWSLWWMSCLESCTQFWLNRAPTSVLDRGSWCVWPEQSWGRTASSSSMRPRPTWTPGIWFRAFSSFCVRNVFYTSA